VRSLLDHAITQDGSSVVLGHAKMSCPICNANPKRNFESPEPVYGVLSSTVYSRFLSLEISAYTDRGP